jgi:hypothetical protein
LNKIHLKFVRLSDTHKINEEESHPLPHLLSYNVVQFSYVIFLLIFPLKAAGASRILGCRPQQSHIGGVIDTTEAPTLSDNFEAIFGKALTCESGDFFMKKLEVKNLMTMFLKVT